MDININKALLPGENSFINNIILTAENSKILYYSPFTLSIILEDKKGNDISDISIEYYLTAIHFQMKILFFNYRYIDYNSWNNERANNGVSENSLIPLYKDLKNVFITKAYKNNDNGYILIDYNHNYDYPGYTGAGAACL
jgi:hypothetical protein